MNVANPVALPLSGYTATHVRFEVSGKVATLTLNRPERKNPLTFETYGELRDTFRDLVYAEEIKAVVISASEDRSSIDAALLAGASAYILKSVSPVDIPSVLRQAATGAVYHVPSVPAPRGQGCAIPSARRAWRPPVRPRRRCP